MLSLIIRLFLKFGSVWSDNFLPCNALFHSALHSTFVTCWFSESRPIYLGPRPMRSQERPWLDQWEGRVWSGGIVRPQHTLCWRDTSVPTTTNLPHHFFHFTLGLFLNLGHNATRLETQPSYTVKISAGIISDTLTPNKKNSRGGGGVFAFPS